MSLHGSGVWANGTESNPFSIERIECGYSDKGHIRMLKQGLAGTESYTKYEREIVMCIWRHIHIEDIRCRYAQNAHSVQSYTGICKCRTFDTWPNLGIWQIRRACREQNTDKAGWPCTTSIEGSAEIELSCDKDCTWVVAADIEQGDSAADTIMFVQQVF